MRLCSILKVLLLSVLLIAGLALAADVRFLKMLCNDGQAFNRVGCLQ
jgi:hypothetical protein